MLASDPEPTSNADAILAAILDGPRLDRPVAELAGACSLDPDDVLESLASLVASGLAVVFAGIDDLGACATLTPLGAERLEVEPSDDLLSRWNPRGKPHKPRGGVRAAGTGDSSSILDRLSTGEPGPLERLVAVEDLERALRVRPLWYDQADRLATPRIVLAGCETTWTERRPPRSGHGPPKRPKKAVDVPDCRECRDRPRDGEGGWCQFCGRGTCRACYNRPLRPTEYCLRCSRWGLDAVLKALLRKKRAKSPASRRGGGPCQSRRSTATEGRSRPASGPRAIA